MTQLIVIAYPEPITKDNVHAAGVALAKTLRENYPKCCSCGGVIELYHSDDIDLVKRVNDQPIHDSCRSAQLGEALVNDTPK